MMFVNTLLAFGGPTVSSLQWLEGSTQNLTITNSPVLPNGVTVRWYRQFTNGSVEQLKKEGSQISICPVYIMLSHVYFYKLLDKYNNTILTSNSTNIINIHCKYYLYIYNILILN